jgi:AraC-like DNA-binding protein
MERMAENGTTAFSNPDDYRSAIGAARVIVTAGGDFNARLTWLNLSCLHAFRGVENLPRIAFIKLSPEELSVSFPISERSSLTYAGIGLRIGDVVFHSRAERMHQRIDGKSQWGCISLPAQQLAFYGKALTGQEITSPPVGRLLRPTPTAVTQLLTLFSRACRLAETKCELIANPEIARALEQELLHALINCLTADVAAGNLKTRPSHADIMVRFEQALAAHSDPHLNLPTLCSTIGVPERTLRVCCTEFLGVSPMRYHLLRRLNMARSALRNADPTTASIAQIARNHQFLEPGRFAVVYRTVFGEMPSSTLRRSRIKAA